MNLHKVLFTLLYLLHVCLGAPTSYDCHIYCESDCEKRIGSTETQEYIDCILNKILCGCKEEDSDVASMQRHGHEDVGDQNFQRQHRYSSYETHYAASTAWNCSWFCFHYWWAVLLGVVFLVGLIVLIVFLCLRRNKGNNVQPIMYNQQQQPVMYTQPQPVMYAQPQPVYGQQGTASATAVYP